MQLLFTVPTAPQNIRIVGYTISQLKVGWDPPDQINGTIKGYHVYLGKYILVMLGKISQLKVTMYI